MKKDKLEELLRAAGTESLPAAPADFEGDVMRAIRAQPRHQPVSLFDQLDALFPRLATASVVVIACCGLLVLGSAAFGESSLTDKVTELSEQWFFAAN
jgi:hypothetical protein